MLCLLNLLIYSSAKATTNFLFTNLNNDNFGKNKGPFKLTYLKGKLKISNNRKVLKTIHLHNFPNKATAKKSRLELSNDCLLRIMDGHNIAWSSGDELWKMLPLVFGIIPAYQKPCVTNSLCFPTIDWFPKTASTCATWPKPVSLSSTIGKATVENRQLENQSKRFCVHQVRLNIL